MTAPPRAVVLVGRDRTGHALLALPVDAVRRDLTTLAALLHSRTFGEVRVDAGAAALLNTSCELWARRLQEAHEDLAELNLDEVLAVRTRDHDPFPDAAEFFGEDWHGWRPEARLLPVAWLQEVAPEVVRWLGEGDQGWGFDYESAPMLPLEVRADLERLLVQRGYEVVECAELAAFYDEPPEPDDWPSVFKHSQRQRFGMTEPSHRQHWSKEGL